MSKRSFQGFTEQEMVNLFAHSYAAEFPDTELDGAWSLTAYQEFKKQLPCSAWDVPTFHAKLSRAVAKQNRD